MHATKAFGSHVSFSVDPILYFECSKVSKHYSSTFNESQEAAKRWSQQDATDLNIIFECSNNSGPYNLTPNIRLEDSISFLLIFVRCLESAQLPLLFAEVLIHKHSRSENYQNHFKGSIQLSMITRSQPT